MTSVPETSTTLLRDLAGDAQHARWGEFVARYRPMMASYMIANFPAVEADDVIQETLVALIRILPGYRYVPDENGAFHNYLTGILRHKALRAVAADSARTRRAAGYAREVSAAEPEREFDERSWRDAVFEIALGQYLADESVSQRTRQVFTRLAVNGESPQDVARAFGIERNAVDQIKSRGMARLRELVKALEKVDDARFDD